MRLKNPLKTLINFDNAYPGNSVVVLSLRCLHNNEFDEKLESHVIEAMLSDARVIYELKKDMIKSYDLDLEKRIKS